MLGMSHINILKYLSCDNPSNFPHIELFDDIYIFFLCLLYLLEDHEALQHSYFSFELNKPQQIPSNNFSFLYHHLVLTHITPPLRRL